VWSLWLQGVPLSPTVANNIDVGDGGTMHGELFSSSPKVLEHASINAIIVCVEYQAIVPADDPMKVSDSLFYRMSA
jgi:hypothetical protein